MHAIDARDFLHALAVVLCVAAAVTVLFRRLHQPVVLGYILAGLIVGPHVPIPLVADPGIVHALSDLGVILLMFTLALDFKPSKLFRMGAPASITAVVECSLMLWLGFLAGRLFGWTPLECFFTGAVVAISSTTILVKSFDEVGIRGRLRDLVVSVLVVEDLVAILLMAVLTAAATGASLEAGPLLTTILRLALFLAATIGIGLLLVPRAIRAIDRLGSAETTLVACVGFCFALALLADSLGYSVALGAFLAGSLVAESGREKEIERLVEPVRDVFAAVFFVSVGMLVDPGLVAKHAGAVAVLTLLVVLGKTTGVSLGAILAGAGLRTSIRAGMSLSQIGEFSFILAGLGLSLGATRDFLPPVAIAVSAITTLLTPWLIRISDPVAKRIDRALPHPVQTFVALYGSWVENLGAARRRGPTSSGRRRLALLLLVDVAILFALVVGASRFANDAVLFATSRFGFSPGAAIFIFGAVAVAVAAPLLFGIARVARSLGSSLAELALPAAKEGRVDLADAPRRAFLVALQLAILALVGVPFLAVTQPFLPGAPGAAVVVLLVITLGIAFWKSATNLQGHVHAGSELLVKTLAKETAAARNEETRRGDAAAVALGRLDEYLPGFGSLAAVELLAGSAAPGRSLADLNLRGATGATVLALAREGGEAFVPRADETLRAGDVVVLSGTEEAIASAKELLEG